MWFWEILPNGVFQNFISADNNIFKVGNKVTSIASIDAFIIISGHIFMHLSSRVMSLLEYLWNSGFTINRKKLHHVFSWKLERLSIYFSQFLWVAASENSSANKNIKTCLKSTTKKNVRTVSVNVIRVYFDYLGTDFNICNGVWFYGNFRVTEVRFNSSTFSQLYLCSVKLIFFYCQAF